MPACLSMAGWHNAAWKQMKFLISSFMHNGQGQFCDIPALKWPGNFILMITMWNKDVLLCVSHYAIAYSLYSAGGAVYSAHAYSCLLFDLILPLVLLVADHEALIHGSTEETTVGIHVIKDQNATV